MSYEMLLSPMSIGKMTVKNRLVMTPVETSMGDMTGKATERLISYYEERAKGGVGLIITATTRVNDLDSASTFNQLAMSHDYHIEPARRLAERIHSHGAKICVQLHHAGRQGYSISTYALPALIPLTKAVPAVKDLVWKSTDMLYKLEEKGLYLPALAPSACEPSYHVFNRVVGMSKRHIKKLERDFIDAAERCQKAGIDGVEATADMIAETKPYAVIVATGAVPVIPRSIKGWDRPNVSVAPDIILGKKVIEGKNVVVVGSGMTGLETTEKLNELGNKVTVIEMADTIAPGTWFQLYDDEMSRINGHGTEFKPGKRLMAIKDNSVIVEDTKTSNLEEIPADEVAQALAEGVQFKYLCAPVEIMSTAKGKLNALKVELMEPGEPDENGRRKSVGTGKYETLKVDCVISAIGQVVDWGALDTGAMRKRPKGTAEADAVTYQTAEPDIFVGGDAYTGPHFAIDAIAAGREGAISLHRFVQEGQSLTLARNPRDFCELDKGDIVLPLGSFDVPARQRPAVDESKIKTFRDEREPFTEEQVRLEASRCLGCGVTVVDQNKCIGCGLCTTRCEFDAIHLSRDVPEASNMVRTEDKLKAIAPYAAKRAAKIAIKRLKGVRGN